MHLIMKLSFSFQNVWHPNDWTILRFYWRKIFWGFFDLFNVICGGRTGKAALPPSDQCNSLIKKVPIVISGTFLEIELPSITSPHFGLIILLSFLASCVSSPGVFSSVTANLTPQQKAALLACGSECKGMLLSFTFKMILLAGGKFQIALYLSTPLKS